MILSRIDLADFGSPDAIAREIVTRMPDLEIPVPIEKLAIQLDILGIEVLEVDGFDGQLLTDENKGDAYILVKQSMPRQRRRFTVGHELFHFLCPTHKPLRPDGFLCTSQDMRLNFAAAKDRAKQMEVEANSFSAQILMPSRHFIKDIRRMKGADLEQVLMLARRYDTSKEATARRYVELHDDQCAAVISKEGRILRLYKGPNFPFVEPRVGNPLPTQSLSATLALDQGTISEWSERDAAIWLPSGRGVKLPRLYEQVLSQSDGYRLTLLTVEAAGEDDEEEADLEESYTPRFRR